MADSSWWGQEGAYNGNRSSQTPCVGYHFNVVLMTEFIADNFKGLKVFSRL